MALSLEQKTELLVNGYIRDEIQTLLSENWIIPKEINDICLQYSPDGEFFGQKGNDIDVKAAKNIATGQMPINSAHRVYGNVIIDFKKTQGSRLDITWNFKINLDDDDGDLYIGLDKANNQTLNDHKTPGSGYFFTNAGSTIGRVETLRRNRKWPREVVLEMKLSINKQFDREEKYSWHWNGWWYQELKMRIDGDDKEYAKMS